MKNGNRGNDMYTEEYLLETIRKQNEVTIIRYITLHLLVFSVILSVTFLASQMSEELSGSFVYGDIEIFVHFGHYVLKIDVVFFLLVLWALVLTCFLVYRTLRYCKSKKTVKRTAHFRLTFIPIEQPKVVKINAVKRVKKVNNNPQKPDEAFVINVQNV